MSLMGKKVKMQFFIEDTGKNEDFIGQITTYDGVTGKYGVYFPCDEEVVYVSPDDEDIVFLS